MICAKNIIIVIVMAIIALAAVEITRQSCSKKCSMALLGNEKSHNRRLEKLKMDQYEKIAVEQQPPIPQYTFQPLPINQLTHGYIDNWHYVGYLFPEDNPNGKRYPLYARKNLYQKHLYDYHVVDSSRNRVKIYIDVPKGQHELYDNDKIKVDSEVGKWVVRIDSPADGNPFLYVPF